MLKQEIQEMKNMIWNTSIVSEGQYDLPVVPHKAVAEVSKIGNLYIGEVGCCESKMAERIH